MPDSRHIAFFKEVIMTNKLKYLWYRFRYTHPRLSFSPPVHLDLELNRSCNCNCIMCYRKNTEWKNKFPDIKMSRRLIKRTLIKASNAGFMSVKFNWRGEPTCYLLLLEYAAKHAKRLGFIDIMINTNGMIRIPKKILQNLTSIAYSIDSENDYIFETMRTPAKLKEVLQNLKYTVWNYSGKVIVQRMVMVGDRDSFKNWEKEIRNIVWANKNKSVIFREYRAENRYSDFAISGTTSNAECAVPYKSITVGANGAAWVCAYAYYEPKQLYLGDLRRHEFVDIFKAHRRFLKTQLHNPICKKCPKQCGGN